MTHDSQLLRMDGGADTTDLLQAPIAGPRGMAPGEQRAQNPVARVRSIMHGRWKYAIPLAIACAAAGAFAGFKSKVPKYRSTAEILFKPTEAKSDGSTLLMPAFQEYVQEQCLIIHSHEEINLALQQKAWLETGKGNTDDVVSEYSRKLLVDHVSGDVKIEYIDEDANVAYAAVKATIEAYKIKYQADDPDNLTLKLAQLDSEHIETQNQIIQLNEQRKAICGQDSVFTPETLESYYSNKVSEMTKAETALVTNQLDLAVLRARLKNAGVRIPANLLTDDLPPAGTEPAAAPATAPAIAAATQPAAVAATPPAPATQPAYKYGQNADYDRAVQSLQDHDPHLQALINRHDDDLADLTTLLAHGYPARNTTVIKAQEAVERDNIAIDQYVARLGGVRGAEPTVAGLDPRLSDLDNLVQSYRQLKFVMESARRQAADLGDKVTRLQTNQEAQESLKRKLDGLTSQRDRLAADLALSNRAKFLSEGDKDYLIYEDKRKSMATLGGTAGALFGFGVLFLMGLFDRRVKTIADAKYTFRRNRRVLGILPTLPDNLGDPRQAAFAAHCVHHVRNLIQLSLATDHGSALAITSASPGEGKTSLTLSLGLSFAAANSRTLMIDCDVVGGGLTARVNAIIRRKMGDVLKRQGRINEQQLALALQLVHQKNIRLGEALVQLGFLSETDIDHALSAQKESLVGLLDVLDGEPLNACIANAGSPNLFILPRGMAVASNSGQVSAKAIRRIIAEARNQYDVVLVDTGPILGSLEASIVASEADGVILAVSRGQQKTLAERAMELLDSIGANTAGIVFNRAQTDDMDTVQYSSSIPANVLHSAPQQTAGDAGSSRLGPIAFAVASATNQSTAHRAAAVNGHVNGNAAVNGSAPAPAATPQDHA